MCFVTVRWLTLCIEILQHTEDLKVFFPVILLLLLFILLICFFCSSGNRIFGQATPVCSLFQPHLSHAFISHYRCKFLSTKLKMAPFSLPAQSSKRSVPLKMLVKYILQSNAVLFRPVCPFTLFSSLRMHF